MKQNRKSSFPVWLLVLLLFALLVFVAVTRVPALLSRGSVLSPAVTAATAEESAPAEEASPAPETPLPEEADASEPEGSTLGDAAEILPEAAAPAETAGLTAAEPSSSEGSNELIVGSTDGYGIPEWGHIHRYKDGVCTVCGQAVEFITDFLPLEFYEESEYPGTVELHKYEITAYANNGYGTYNKSFNTYLPYGYDGTKPYNVLVLVHGGGGDEDSWLNTVYSYQKDTIKMSGRVILDNMFAKGICEPCIVVCPVTEIPQCQGLTASTNQLRQELREYILPYVVEHYSTYAADSSLESLQAARDHFGLGGLSNGALFVYEGGMRYNFDLFGSYMALSGNGEPWNTMSVLHNTEGWRELPFNCYFTGAGTVNDWQQNYTQIGYDYFLEHEPERLADGKNAFHVDVEGEHEWKVWFTDLYNALPLMFPD